MLHGQLVILDVDLADLCGIEPKRLADLVQQNQTILSVEFSFVVESNEIPGPTRALPTDTELARKIEALEKSVATLDAKTRKQFEEVYRMIRTLGAPLAPKKPPHRELH